MKRHIIITTAMLAAAISAGAQNMYDASLFGDTEYYGSARTMGMGNAVTAVGGDLGSVGINPAGSAVAGYSQFVLTPGLSWAASGSSWNGGTVQNANKFRFGVPNFGFTCRLEGDGESSLTSMTLGFVLNRTGNQLSYMSASGLNNASSKFAEMASVATYRNLAPSDFSGNPYYNDATSDIWDVVMGYDCGLFNKFGDHNEYVACTEALYSDGTHGVPGDLIQRYSVLKAGSKNDIIFNLGLNYGDDFYLGFNMGIPVMSYSSTETYSEVSKVPELFPVTFGSSSTLFSDAAYQYAYNAELSGIYAKVGFIWLPFGGLRLGGAIQTRTLYEVQESWLHACSVNYTDSRFSASGHSETGEYNYNFKSPWSFNLGAAYTLGSFAMISADYELTDYGSMRYSYWYDDMNDDYYAYTNEVLKTFYGVQHNLRVGAEVNLTPLFAVRAGWGVRTCAEKYYHDAAGDVTGSDYSDDYYLGRDQLPAQWSYYDDKISFWSAGIGYNSFGSFFADLAVKRTSYPSYRLSPYYDYYTYDYNGEDLVDAGYFEGPSVESTRKLWTVALTFGFRF